jgi:hypothetical protein
MCWGHLDVDDRDVRFVRSHLAKNVIEIPGLPYHLYAGIVEEARDSGPQEQRILAEDYTHSGCTQYG